MAESDIKTVIYLSSRLAPPILASFNKSNVPVSPDNPVIQLCPTDVSYGVLSRLTQIIP